MIKLPFAYPPPSGEQPYTGFWTWERIQLGIVIGLVSSLLVARWGPDRLQAVVRAAAIAFGLRWSYLLVLSDYDYQKKFGVFLFFATLVGGTTFFISKFFL